VVIAVNPEARSAGHEQAAAQMPVEQRNWLVRFDKDMLSRWPAIRCPIVRYFRPFWFETYRKGLVYRLLGIRLVAYLIPTGGLLWRRLFKWKGWSFALVGPSIRAAGEFRYSTCVFESLHLGALLLMLPDGIRAIHTGCQDGLLKFGLAGLLMNGYPLLLQRYNRVRIQHLLEEYAARQAAKSQELRRS
jgi:hypothetical protein